MENAKVFPILKPDKNLVKASNYRPINLLSEISKKVLFENALRKVTPNVSVMFILLQIY